jgi:excinuclease UvrABC ATPase subunit
VVGVAHVCEYLCKVCAQVQARTTVGRQKKAMDALRMLMAEVGHAVCCSNEINFRNRKKLSLVTCVSV